MLDLLHHPKAFNRWGAFCPVILHSGRIVGDWKKKVKKDRVTLETSFFGRKPGNYEEPIKKPKRDISYSSGKNTPGEYGKPLV